MRDFLSVARCDDPLDTGSIVRKHIGLPYSAPDGSLRTFDLYYPEAGDGPFPIILSVAGGGWYFGIPSSVHLGETIHTAISRGYAVASMACTSSRDHKFPYQVWEIRGLIRHLCGSAQTLKLDAEWMALWGASSGGHLSLMTALTVGEPEFDLPPVGRQDWPDVIKAVVAIYPVCRVGCTEDDFRVVGLKPDFICSGERCTEAILLGVPVEENPTLCRWASPNSYITPGAPPLLLLHGMADTVVPYSSSLDFVLAYQDARGPGQVMARFLPGAGHSDPCFKTRSSCENILDFLDRVRQGETPCPPAYQGKFFCTDSRLF